MKDIDDSEMSLIDNPDAQMLNQIIKPTTDVPSIQQILLALISDKDNIELKTEIHNPFALTLINMFGKMFKRKDYGGTDKFIAQLIQIYLEYMVSNKRKSRTEIEHILSSWMDKLNTDSDNRLVVKAE